MPQRKELRKAALRANSIGMYHELKKDLELECKKEISIATDNIIKKYDALIRKEWERVQGFNDKFN